MDNVTRFPITNEQRKKNENGLGYVPCKVSNRWLQFNSASSQMHDGQYIMVNVMTMDSDGYDKKLCELVLAKEDLLAAISNAKLLE